MKGDEAAVLKGEETHKGVFGCERKVNISTLHTETETHTSHTHTSHPHITHHITPIHPHPHITPTHYLGSCRCAPVHHVCGS